MVILCASMLDFGEFDIMDAEVRNRFIIAALKHGIPEKPSQLKIVAQKLTEKPGLLESLVASPDGAKVIKQLFTVHFVRKVTSICHNWASKLVGLVEYCSGSPRCHGISYHVKRWRAFQEVIAAMEKILRATPKVLQQNRTYPHKDVFLIKKDDQHLQPFGSQKQRESVHKARATKSLDAPPPPPLPHNIIVLLDELGMKRPESLRAVKVLLDHLQEQEIPDVLRYVLETFPCRPCHDISRESTTLQARKKRQESVDFGIFTKQPAQEEILFSSKLGLWKMLLSAKALKDIQRETQRGGMNTLESRLRKLASGDWKGDRFSHVIPTKGLHAPLLEAEAGKILRILWQIDIGFCEDGVYRHHIKIWRVVDRDHVKAVSDNLVKVLRNQIRDDLIDFSYPEHNSEGIYIPTDYHVKPLSSEAAVMLAQQNSKLSITDIDRKQLQVYNKFYEFTKPVMDSFLAGNLTAEFPFDTSPEEIAIIKHYESGTLIMGRSGTGKTTCLVQKLLRNYASARSIIGQPQPRQILLTRSKFLAEKLKKYTKRLVDSQVDNNTSPQLGLEVHEFSLGDESAYDTKSLSTLREEDFPLVLTFDTLLTVLENTIAGSHRQQFNLAHSRRMSEVNSSYHRRAQIVDFTLFRQEYWKQFPSFKNHYEPGLVFSEFMGIIKGSAMTESRLEYLTKEEYLDLSHKQAPTFTTQQREAVYSLYLLYEKRKKLNGDRDGIDRVVTLLRFLRNDSEINSIIKTFFDELYVDEVQDQRTLDLLLLLRLILNPRAIHLAGDTAQCISKDSTFRFADVKHLFYEVYSPLASATSHRELAVPSMFKLSKNFRSHQGIISLASFVMKLLYTGFPQTVDKMEEERGQYAGPIPTMFLGFGAQILGSRLVGLQDVNDGQIADFGAEQVILVRDEQQKERVQQEIGDLALVLTILDSKGMEFDDVFLLDFFTSSPKPATLRRLRWILAEDSTVLQQETIGMDGLLCSELKHLYVAVTRPRNQLWIFESDTNVVEPVVMLLAGDIGQQKDGSNDSKQPLVEVVGKDHPQLKQKLKMLKPAESSDPKKYSEMGYQLIQRGLFKDANFCFRKAKDERGQTIAKAHLSMEEGRGFRASGKNGEFIRLFMTSVDLFKQAGQLGNAAFCLEEMNYLEEAGDIWISISRHDKAAPLYMQARCWHKASTSFDIIERYGDAAAALRQGELFTELIAYIARNRDLLEPAQTASYGKLCAILVAQGRIKQDMQEHIIEFMGTEREKEEFYRKFKMSRPLVALLKKKAEFGAAVQELIDDGKPVDALELGLNNVAEDPTINQQELIKLINYVEYRKLLRLLFRLSLDENKIKPVKEYLGLPLKIYDALHSWQMLFNSIKDRTLRKVFMELPNGSILKDILSCTIAMHGDQKIPIETIRGSQFVMDALVVTVNIWNSVRNDDQELPLPLAIVVGAYQLFQSNEVLLFDYTPISAENVENKHSKWIDVTPKALSQLLERMLPLYLRLEVTLSPLWKSEARPLCQNYAIYGQCARQDTCKRHHSIAISPENAQSRVEDLMSMALLCATFQVVYYRTKNGFERFSESYLPRTRFWVESLLTEIIFRSALEQDVEVAAGAFEVISRDRKNAALSSWIERLLFHRLRKGAEWHVRCDFSSLLEAIQLSTALGPRVLVSLREYIKRDRESDPIRLMYTSFHCHQKDVYDAIACLQRCLYFCKTADAQSFNDNITRGLALISRYEWADYQNFHAVMTIFEQIATYLYLWVFPSAFLLPRSWTRLHLGAVVSDPAKVNLNPESRDIYSNCLINLLDSFAEIILYLNRNFQEFNFTFGTRRNFETGQYQKSVTQSIAVHQRSANFLVIALINLATPNTPLRGSGDFYNKCQPIFRHRNYAEFYFEGRSPQALPAFLKSSFQKFNGKDQLTLLTAKPNIPVSIPNVLTAFVKDCTFHTLADLMKLMTARHTPSGDSQENMESAKAELDAAALKIQLFWRKRKSYLVSYRKEKETSEGKATALVYERIIRPHRQDLDRSSRIAKSYTLLTEGKDFYVAYSTLRRKARAALVLSDKVVNDVRVSSQDLEQLISGPLLKDLDGIYKSCEKGGRLYDLVTPEKVADIFKNSLKQNVLINFFKLRQADVRLMMSRLREIEESLERMHRGCL
ncbi:hypothetical protein BZA77DRAFT_172956 [Pyronema omphalodes]|nr:hypothetical protein BZA77DRAFT_172956 [Pyronema omphalodes]